MADWLLDGSIGWLAGAVLAVINLLWGLLSDKAFSTPDVTVLPQVTTITSTSMMIVNASFILAVLATGIIVMTRETVQNRYGIAELAPRLVIGWIAANFAMPICANLIELANAVTTALTGDSITSKDSLTQVRTVTVTALTDPASALFAVIIGLVIAVLTAMLILTWIVRLGVLVVLVGISPVALACHATPYTDGAARLWWRAMLGTLATVLLQALALHVALSIFLDPDANVAPLGIPRDSAGSLNLFLVLCVLWVVIQIPGLMSRYVTAGGGGGGRNVAGLIVRMVFMQQLTSMLRLPLRHGARGANRATAAGIARGGRRGGGGGLTPGRLPLPAPRGAGQGRVGVAWPTGRPVWPYTRQELAAGVDSYTRTVPRRPDPAATPRSTRPPIRAAGVQPPPAPSGPRPVIPAGVNPATAMPRTRPIRPPVTGPWNRPARRR
jgi:hypothetical protein